MRPSGDWSTPKTIFNLVPQKSKIFFSTFFCQEHIQGRVARIAGQASSLSASDAAVAWSSVPHAGRFGRHGVAWCEREDGGRLVCLERGCAGPPASRSSRKHTDA